MDLFNEVTISWTYQNLSQAMILCADPKEHGLWEQE